MSRATWRLSRPYCQSDVWRPFGASRAFRLATADASGHVGVTLASRPRSISFVRLYKLNGPVSEKTPLLIKPLCREPLPQSTNAGSRVDGGFSLLFVKLNTARAGAGHDLVANYLPR